ncbi:hypothetical protein [Pantoea vagans]|uniref:glycine-rich domain-containing protein n=1 Tax=Pantoea vagans TaxID=470934 RepID=UPI003018B1EC
MQNSSQPKLLPIPFADSGSKQTIPNDSQVGITAGRASYTDGFPPLTRTPLAAGGVPPFGTDFNGVLNDITAAIRWTQSGAGYPFNADFNTAVSGYPKGARIPNSSLDGYWLNTVDGNTSNPEVTGSATTGWVPSDNYGSTAITGLSGSSVTLTTLQASKERITLAGALSANINIVIPAWKKSWTVVNGTTGSFSVTVKTPSGTGVTLAAGQTQRVIGDGTNITLDQVPIRFAKYTSTGSFTVPLGVTTVYLSGCAGGGGGGGGSSRNSTSSAATGGGGGGAGQSAVRVPVTVTPGQVIAVSVGAGGTSGTASTASSAGAGGTGGITSFGSLLSLAAGVGGNGGTYSTSTSAGGVGGTGYPSGGTASTVIPTTSGGYGIAGAGGSTAYGGGGSGGICAGASTSAGGDSYGYGSGGGGGGANNIDTSGAGKAGGVGSAGLLIVEW